MKDLGKIKPLTPLLLSPYLPRHTRAVTAGHTSHRTAEAQAIAYHDGMYVPEGRSVAHKEEPLHWADMWTARCEGKKKSITNIDEHIEIICNH